MESQIEREIRRKEKLITKLSHGQRPTKLNGRKRKGVDEYAAEYEADFTTSSIEQDGEFVQFLVCRYCTSQIIGARSDRIKEHLTSQRHQKNKWGNCKPTDTDTQQQTQNGGLTPETSKSPQYFEEKKIAIEKLPKTKHKTIDPEKGAGKVNRKTVGEYANEYSSDLTTSTIQRDGTAVDILICRYCNCPIGPRSDRIKEHLISKRHQNNKSRSDVQSLPSPAPSRAVPVADIPDLPQATESEMPNSTTLSVPNSDIKKVRRFANVKLVDVGKMIHECKLCGRLVPTSADCQKDQKIFLNNYKCSRCNFEGNSVDEYHVHMSLHDVLQPCNCQHFNTTNGNNGCDQTFANKSNSNLMSQAMKKHLVGRKSGAQSTPDQSQSTQLSHPPPQVTTITTPSTEYNYNINTMDVFQNNVPMSNPYPSPTQGMRFLENFYELTAGEIKSENYITLQLDFSEY